MAVQGVSILAFLNPIILSALCAAFLLVYSRNVERRSALWFAFSYGVATVGFFVDFLRDSVPPIAISLSTNTLFMLSIFCAVKGLAARYERTAPLLPMALCMLGGYAVVFWFFYVDPNITRRTIGINMAIGGLALCGMGMIWRLKLSGIDRVLRAVFGIFTAQFFVRTFLVFWLSDNPISQAGYLASPYAVTLQFTVAVISMAFAATLLSAVIQDHLSDLKKESTIDALSGVLNRRGFEAAAAQAFGKGGIAPALVIADLDHFKRINDTHGHGGGDAVIAAFGTLLKALFGPGAEVGRIGGEEFAVLFPHTTAGDAARHAERARQTLATLSLPGGLAGERISASFGVCAAERGMTLAEAMSRADAALYEAKRCGRNRVAVHDPVPREVTSGRIGLGFAAQAA